MPSRPTMIPALRALLIAAGAWLPGGCAPEPPPGFTGYLEAEYVYVSPALAGTLESLHIRRGETIEAHALIAVIEHQAEQAAFIEATHRLAQARARLENLTKGLRPSEIAALEAQAEQARQSLLLSDSELARRQQLYDTRVIAVEELDQARTRRDRDQARLDELRAVLETARLGARDDEIQAAEAEVRAEESAVARAKWAVDEKTLHAPVSGTVHDTLYRPGEWVAAGRPVVSLLPPGNIKARFWVPQEELPRFPPGQGVWLHLDGLPEPYPATVNYVSTRAEFTPPVIYSKSTRAKLVFMIEAALAAEHARLLRPGQPIDVRRQP